MGEIALYTVINLHFRQERCLFLFGWCRRSRSSPWTASRIRDTWFDCTTITYELLSSLFFTSSICFSVCVSEIYSSVVTVLVAGAYSLWPCGGWIKWPHSSRDTNTWYLLHDVFILVWVTKNTFSLIISYIYQVCPQATNLTPLPVYVR
jgi:hypothetical protein